jgi:hypothetical protein
MARLLKHEPSIVKKYTALGILTENFVRDLVE